MRDTRIERLKREYKENSKDLNMDDLEEALG